MAALQDHPAGRDFARTMTPAGRKKAVLGELAVAWDELEVSEALLGLGKWRVALTRAYFAAFHAVRALLYSRDFEPKSHHGALELFRRELVKAGEFPATDSYLLSELQRYREEADYEGSFVIEPAKAKQLVDSAKDLVARLTKNLPDAT